jgi:hypothetical protein
MTARVARLAALTTLLLLASASAGASRVRPSVALTASPSHVRLAGAGRAVVRVTNPGATQLVVDVRRAGFALDLRGRPRIVPARGVRRTAARWLSFHPRTLVLGPGATRPVRIVSRPPARAEPGDHDALVLLTSRRRVKRRVAVRMRVGVVVAVRVPGVVRRRLDLHRVRVVGVGRVRTLELLVANRGNVTESFSRRRSMVSLRRAGRGLARLTAAPRTLRPRTTGVLQFRLQRTLRGMVNARVDVTTRAGTAIRRTLRIRL